MTFDDLDISCVHGYTHCETCATQPAGDPHPAIGPLLARECQQPTAAEVATLDELLQQVWKRRGGAVVLEGP